MEEIQKCLCNAKTKKSEEREILTVVRLWKGKAEQRSAVKSGKSEPVQEITGGLCGELQGREVGMAGREEWR